MYECSPDFDMPPPRSRGGKVVFLDFDGCTHPSEVYWRPGIGPFLFNCPGHTLFENVPVIEHELAPYPEVRIVLSTSWVVRYHGSLRRLAAKLGPLLCKRVVGATYHSRMRELEFRQMSRGQQVCADVARRRPENWMALDDDELGWPLWCERRLVLTDPVFGIAAPAALAKFRIRLQEMHGTLP
ncbi:HAD domain-containing protein [Caballeronia novacaledonica]|uniref:HAD domain-containing protein n=1 Tax=Caballeronia novacaledonica TaxID=1544861 RepID=UPI0028524F3B|nr:HAD domain-containing protein [Caballeronia novacaledonica]